MNYPTPRQKNIFYYQKKSLNGELPDGKFSWETENIFFEEFRKNIQKTKKILKYIPFVEQVYLCNSISFNAIHGKSDIDLFIVTSEKRIWQCRFWSVILFRINGLKRSKKDKTKKICLSFYVTKNNLNLYTIKVSNNDIYLVYRIAHLVPLYTRKEEEIENIRKANKRFQNYLPNHPMKQSIFINEKIEKGYHNITRLYEKYNNGLLGDIVENLIKFIWLPIIFFKTMTKKNQGKNIIVNDYMLKFYADKREKIAYLFKIKNK